MLARLDKFERLATDAQLCVCVLSNLDVTDIELVDLNAVPLPDETVRDFTGRGLRFIGAIGIVDGVRHTALAEPIAPARIAALSTAFTRYCEVLLDESLGLGKGDEITWLRDLWRKDDPRPDA